MTKEKLNALKDDLSALSDKLKRLEAIILKINTIEDLIGLVKARPKCTVIANGTSSGAIFVDDLPETVNQQIIAVLEDYKASLNKEFDEL